MDRGNETAKFAVLDWGIGGFGLVTELVRRALGCEIVYCSDSGFTPYGLVSRAALRRRMALWTDFARDQGATHLVVACNAASSALPDTELVGWQQPPSYSLPTAGIIAHGLAAVHDAAFARLGVIGGARTVRSGVYARPLRRRDVTVLQRVAQPLSAFVERAELGGAEVTRSARRVLAPLRSCDGIVLACTHYPALLPVLTEVLPNKVWLDPVTHLATWLEGSTGLQRGDTTINAWTTGCAVELRVGAQSAFGVAVQAKEIPSLD